MGRGRREWGNSKIKREGYMSKVVLGVTADGKPFAIDLVLLLETRLLLSANSGGGKSYTLRQLIEQIFGKVQILLIDREGEFKSLRDQYDFLLVGDGGDIPAHIGSARLLAEKLLESGVSAICDLYEAFRTRPIDRLAWVREFLMGLVDAPKHLWHDVIVIVDEAHLFCPEVAPKGRNMEERDIINGCKDAVVALCTVGRKRGQTAVLATQRLAKLDKDASAELLNRMIGMTLEGQDVDRAIDLMSIPKDEKSEFRKSLRELEPGNLYAFGRAISKERIFVKINKVQTKHHDPRSRKHVDYSPPTPAKIKALLSKFEGLPKEIEQKAKTEADLRKENQALRGQVVQLERKLKAPAPLMPAKPVVQKVQVPVEKRIEVPVEVPVLKEAELKRLEKLAEKVHLGYEGVSKAAGEINHQLVAIRNELGKSKSFMKPVGYKPRSFEQQQDERIREAHDAFPNPRVVKTPSVKAPVSPRGQDEVAVSVDDEPVSDLQLRQLTGLLDFEGIGIQKVPRRWLSGWLGMSLSGHFKNEFGKLKKRGWIEYEGMLLILTEDGRLAAPPSTVEISESALLERCASAVSELSARQLRHLHSIHPTWVSREYLAEELGMSLSGHFKNEFGKLHKAGMIDYGDKKSENRMKLKCADWLFVEQSAQVT